MFKQHSDETLNCQINTTEDIKRYDKDLLSLSMNTQLHVTNRKSIFGSRYPRTSQVKFAEDSLQKILLGPFLNTLTHLSSQWLYLFSPIQSLVSISLFSPTENSSLQFQDIMADIKLTMFHFNKKSSENFVCNIK